MMPPYQVAFTLVALLALSGCNDSNARRSIGPDAAEEDASGETDADMDAAIADDAAAEEDARTDACVDAIEICNGLDEDCDGMVDEGLRIACLVDADGDHHAISKNETMLCPDPTRPEYGGCPAGYQTAASPGLADCDDTNPALHGNVRVRRDADGDGFCIGPTEMPCGPETPAAPYRHEAQCEASLDCRDVNPHATTSCVLPSAFSTTSRLQNCGVGGSPAGMAFLSVVMSCPEGFNPTSFTPVSSAPETVSCLSSSESAAGAQITQACLAGLGQATCHVVADCVAN